ncbi:hypothetical protein ACFLRO_01070 [Bacteroidota bacterium]
MDVASREGVQLRGTVHGLDVFAEHPPVARIEATARGGVIRQSMSQPSERLSREFEDVVDLPPRTQLAVELYNLTLFDSTPETRFLSLVTVVEVLASRARRAHKLRQLLTRFIDSVDEAGLDAEQAQVLKQGLGNLKRESVGQACRRLVGEMLDQNSASYFADCYSARSELLHTGATDKNIGAMIPQLHDIVHRALLAIIRESKA